MMTISKRIIPFEPAENSQTELLGVEVIDFKRVEKAKIV
jgi:hypothetical protein